MTLQEFKYHYRVATGINWLTPDWIEAHKPSEYNDKLKYFTKLVKYIELLKNHHYGEDNQVKKYGRFNVDGTASDLSNKLLELIFGTASGTFDNSANVATGLVLTCDNLSDISTDKYDTSFLYLLNTSIDRVFKGYTYNEDFAYVTDYTVVNTDNSYTNINQATEELVESDLQVQAADVDDITALTVLYQVASNTYLVYEYNKFSNSWIRKEQTYNDGSDTIDIGLKYLLDDEGEYILTSDGEKIIVN